MRYANDIALFMCVLYVCVRLSAAQSGPPQASCPANCPPSWVNLLQEYMPMIGNLNHNHSVCRVATNAGLLNSCSNPGNRCNPHGSNPAFVCCPASCLSSVPNCIQGPQRQNLCVPTDISSWQNQFIQAFLSGITG
ncbi:uncharacterized protein LOC128219728 [Mya arenaria]|uniref:uncharacterized protein LOC128219728 n=1 Tax=Mya arenaria TaxID=6604 RepID=UPI0022E83623|nr:uncharacterized protein LOC128219728 [Mya arenaria]